MSTKTDLDALSELVFGRTRARLQGMTDHEYRRAPAPPPFTTLEWRLRHLADAYGNTRNSEWLGVAVDAPAVSIPGDADAAAAIELLERAYQRWAATLVALSDDQLDAPLGPAAGPFAAESKRSFVLHMLDEFIHHGAEIGVLRDLFRGS